MKRAQRFHRHTPVWCWAVLAIAAAAVLPARPLVIAGDAPAAAQAEKKAEKPAEGTNVSLLAPVALPAPPLTYNAVSDTKVYPKPPLPKLGPAGFVFKDPTFGCPIVRGSDEKTFNGDPIHTPAGAAQNTWNTDSTLFVLETGGGGTIPFQFDPKTLKVSRIPGLDTLPGIGGDAPFSYHDKHVCWGKDVRRNMIVKYNFATQKATDVCDVTKVTGLPVVSGHLGAFGLSANDCLNLTFGGAGQNRDPYLLWYDAKSNTHHVWNTEEGTIDGKPIPDAPHFTQHASEIDRSGRYIWTAPGRGSDVPWIWDVQQGTVYPMRVQGMGHRAVGYGDMVNDMHLWLYRTLDPEGIKTFKPLMAHPAGEPYFQYDSHESWNNARPGMHVPILISTYHHEPGDPKCVWGDEVIAVSTDGSMKVWRFCHHRSAVHMPTRDASGGRTMPKSRENMAAEQPYNFWDTPRGNVSQDGRFFMFTSNWEDTVGKDRAGRFREDVFIVKLDREGAAELATPVSEIPATKPSAPAAAEKPAAAEPRTSDSSAGKSSAGDVDISRVRQLMEKRRSGQTLTADEQAYLDRAMAARGGARPNVAGQRPAGQPAGNTPAGDIDINRARQLLAKQRSGQELTPEEQAYLEQVKKARAKQGGQRPDPAQNRERGQRPDAAQDFEKPAQNFDKAERAMGHDPLKGELTKEEFIKAMQQLASEKPDRAEEFFNGIKKADPNKITKDEYVTHQKEMISGGKGK